MFISQKNVSRKKQRHFLIFIDFPHFFWGDRRGICRDAWPQGLRLHGPSSPGCGASGVAGESTHGRPLGAAWNGAFGIRLGEKIGKTGWFFDVL